MTFVGTAGYLPPEGPRLAAGRHLQAWAKFFTRLAPAGISRQDFPELPAQWQEFVDQKGLLEFNAVLMKACTSDARKRYQSAGGMHSDLALLQAGKSVQRLRMMIRTAFGRDHPRSGQPPQCSPCWRSPAIWARSKADTSPPNELNMKWQNSFMPRMSIVRCSFGKKAT